MFLLSWQWVASIGFSPLMNIHQAAVLAHRFRFSIRAGRGTSTLRIHTTMVFSAECKHSAAAECPADGGGGWGLGLICGHRPGLGGKGGMQPLGLRYLSLNLPTIH